MGEDEPVNAEHLEEALRREYRKAGAAYPFKSSDQRPGQKDRLRHFTSKLE